MKVGDFVVERLYAWGVRRIYGYPGDCINGVIGALQRPTRSSSFRSDTRRWLRSWQLRTPNSLTRSASACRQAVLAPPTSSPAYTMPSWTTRLFWRFAVRLKQLSGAPATNRNSILTACSWMWRFFAQEASAPAQVRHLIDRCIRVAKASNGPSVLILPKDPGRGLQRAGGRPRVHTFGNWLQQAESRS
jgi:pyruvate dehydrogenase (quinone)